MRRVPTAWMGVSPALLMSDSELPTDLRRPCTPDRGPPYGWPRYSWTSRIARVPSPTAVVIRLDEPARTSPAAKTPGTLVSSESGVRAGADFVSAGPGEPVRSAPVRM